MFEIRDVRQIRLLASPVRQAIVDALESSGPQSAADLASILGYAPDALYHHLRKMLRGGLLTAEYQRGGGGKRCAVFSLSNTGTRLHYAPSNRQNRIAITAVATTMLRDASRTFAKAMTRTPVVKGPRRNLWVGRRTGWLTQAQLEQLNDRLVEIVKLMESGVPRRGRTKLYALTFALSPFGTKRQNKL
jgi:DNA-binding transcriptional ArsR family regulator